MTVEEKRRGTHLLTFALLACCFVLWGVVNGLMPHLSDIYGRAFLLTPGESMLPTWAFLVGYFVFAIPTGLFIRQFTYRAGVLLGMIVLAVSTMLYYPFAMMGFYMPLVVLSFMCGASLSCLETSASPYVMALGDRGKAMVRLNMAQSFNTVGWLTGSYFIIVNVSDVFSPFTAEQRSNLSEEFYETMKRIDLQVVGTVEMWLCLAVTAVAMLVALMSVMPKDDAGKRHERLAIRYSLDKLFSSRSYVWGLVALTFYIAAQTTCWDSISRYGVEVLTATGDYVVSQAIGEVRSYLLCALLVFGLMRFACSFAMVKVQPRLLLISMSVVALVFSVVAVISDGMWQIYSMVVVSACMSLMFPTIFCKSLEGLDTDTTKIGSAGLIMTIGIGNLLPFLQLLLLRRFVGENNAEMMQPFYLLVVSFGVILLYGLRLAGRTR